MRPRATLTITILCLIATLALVACQSGESSTSSVAMLPTQTPSPGQTIVLGDIDPDEPAKKIRRFSPLAQYLAQHLKDYGIERGKVVIARDFDEMERFLKDGTVDIYFDSPFPTLAVRKMSETEVILRRWKQGQPTYWSTYIVLRDSGIDSVKDFAGKILAFEERHSTSGFLLPAGTLVQRGLTLREVDGFDAVMAAHEVGYFFSLDEENTIVR